MRPVISDFNVGGDAIAVDSLTMWPPYVPSGTFTSRVLDAGLSVSWTSAQWAATAPTGTSITMSARFGNTVVPDGSWTPFIALPQSGTALTQVSRYVQYQAVLTSTGQATPSLSDVTFVAGGFGLPSVSVNDAIVDEGNSATSNATFLLTLTSASSQEVRVSYTTANGTAAAGSDYTTTTGVAIFAPGATSTTVQVPIVGDTTLEADETFVLNLSAPVNASLGDAQAVGTIANDELPSLTVNDVTVTEGNGGTTMARFTVSSSASTTKTMSVSYSVGGGTATAGTDYVGASGTLNFAGGVTQKFIDVAVTGDVLNEPNETFVVTLAGAVNAAIGDAQGTGTITNDDPVPQLSIADVSVTEGNSGSSAVTFTVTLAGASANTVTVQYATQNGTASAADYSAGSGTLSFDSGATTRTFTVNVTGDVLDEDDETFLVNLSSPVGATLSDSQATATIVDNDASPSLAINNAATLTEGNSGSQNAVFTVTLSAASGRTVTVAYATANGTAVSPADFTSVSGTLTFNPGVLSQAINVPVLGDTLDEASESFTVNLSNATNASISDNQGSGSITDNDAAPTLAISNVTVTEGDSGTTNATFAVSLSAPSGLTITVNYATANSSATQPSDYLSRSGTLTFPAGTTSLPIDVPVVGDTVGEASETFFVNLSNASNASIADSQGVATINDTDPRALSINDVAFTEGGTGGNAVFTVTLTPAHTTTVTVAYATANGTAVQPGDYSSRSGTLTFAAGTTTQTISVPVINDTLDEANETFVVNLSSPTNAVILDNQGVGTINDNDAAPSLVINNPAAVSEGNSGTTNVTFTVTLSAVSGQTVTVNYATANSSATQPADYSSRSGTLTFAPGTTTQTVVVPVVGDTLDEENETFVVNLSGATNASIADSQGFATITDDDASPSLVINNTSVAEGNSGTRNMTFTVTLSAASGREVRVNYATQSGTATVLLDYFSTSGTLVFAPGVTSMTINVSVRGDNTNENNETVLVNLTSPVNVTIADSQGVGTIVDDE
jgi:hypothetical protein